MGYPQPTLPLTAVAVPTPDLPLRLVILRVEPQTTKVYGDPLLAISLFTGRNRKHVVYLDTADIGRTWGCNHPTDENLQHETEIVSRVTAWMEAETSPLRSKYPVVAVGFSSSGYGAMSLLSRHPNVFSGAICFDAPLTVTSITDRHAYDLGTYVGTDRQFQSLYRLTDSARYAALLGKQVLLSGWDLFDAEITGYSNIMSGANVGYCLRLSSRAHTWNSGWFEDALSAFPPA